MIGSTLRFDDVEDIPGLLPLLQAVQRSTATAGCIKWTIIVSGAICTPYMDWSGTGLCIPFKHFWLTTLELTGQYGNIHDHAMPANDNTVKTNACQ